jgi:hypothetical protein
MAAFYGHYRSQQSAFDAVQVRIEKEIVPPSAWKSGPAAVDAAQARGDRKYLESRPR